MREFLGLVRPIMNPIMRCGNEAFEERMGLVRLAVKFGMELAGNEKGVVSQFDDFHQLAIGRETAENKTRFFEALAVRVVELVAVAVTFVDHKRAVEPSG